MSTVLMIIGGDVVRTALAQSTGTLFTPVCFSFGWVSYAFMAVLGVLGDGRLLPPPDYPVKVFNLNSGYVRDNKNWVIGRILRDHEAAINRISRCDEGIRISVFEADTNPNCWTRFSYNWIHFFGLFWMISQILIAAIPVVIDQDWSILLVTSVGTILALAHGALPQWTAEKLPNRQHANIIFGLTTGNGSRDIMIIKGEKRCLNLEEFSVSDTPRNGRPWEKFSKKILTSSRTDPEGHTFRRTGSMLRDANMAYGFPVGFWITFITTIVQSIFWLALLVTVAAVKQNTWYLLLIGGIGMFQNGIVAAAERPPKTRNLPLRHMGTITRRKVMDGLMDLEDSLKCARPFVKEFFPGDLTADEKAWWHGNREAYESRRREQIQFRGPPGCNGFDPSPGSDEMMSKDEVEDERLTTKADDGSGKFTVVTEHCEEKYSLPNGRWANSIKDKSSDLGPV